MVRDFVSQLHETCSSQATANLQFLVLSLPFLDSYSLSFDLSGRWSPRTPQKSRLLFHCLCPFIVYALTLHISADHSIARFVTFQWPHWSYLLDSLLSFDTLTTGSPPTRMKWKWRKSQAPTLPTADDAASDHKDSATTQKEQARPKRDGEEPEKEKEKAPLSNYWRIISYGSKGEHGLMLGALVASAASGAPMPLMQIVFGNLTGTFNSYSIDQSRTQSDFNDTLDRYS